MNPIKIDRLEKRFGPYIAGKGDPQCTVSATDQIAKGAGKGTFIGAVGILPGAKFHILFPEPVDLSEFATTKNGVRIPIDAVVGLAREGKQGDQGRIRLFEQWQLQRAWRDSLATLRGDLEAEIFIPSLGQYFNAKLAVTGSGAKRKVSLKGDLVAVKR